VPEDLKKQLRDKAAEYATATAAKVRRNIETELPAFVRPMIKQSHLDSAQKLCAAELHTAFVSGVNAAFAALRGGAK